MPDVVLVKSFSFICFSKCEEYCLSDICFRTLDKNEGCDLVGDCVDSSEKVAWIITGTLPWAVYGQFPVL